MARSIIKNQRLARLKNIAAMTIKPNSTRGTQRSVKLIILVFENK
ncbi:hypothetical protein [Microseira wollei]|nr:hypothetical protein [Microseira wollei]